MSDRDLIDGLHPPYAEIYKQICEGEISPERIAYNLFKKIWGSVRHYFKGEPIMQELVQISQLLDQVRGGPLFRSDTDLLPIRNEIDTVGRSLPFHYEPARNITLAACKQYVDRLLEGYPDIHHLRGLSSCFLQQIYTHYFGGRLGRKDHPNQLPDNEFRGRLDRVRELLFRTYLDPWAQSAAQKQSFAKYQPRFKAEKMEGDTDVLAYIKRERKVAYVGGR